MGRVIDLLEPALEEIKMNGKKFLDEDFMMGIFSELLNTIPPFREYWDFIFEEKQTATVGSTTDKMLPFDQLRAELFYPQSKTNQDTTEMVEALAVEVAKAILTELRDPNKATSNYLTSASGKFSWGYTSAADKVSGLGKCATNDDAERPFGGLTSELQRFGRIGLTNAGGITQARVNGDFYRSKSKKGDDVVEGLFHQLPTEMKQSLFATAMEDAPVTIKADSEALARQRDSKRMKEEVLRQRGFMAAKENLVDAIVYHKMYGSLACWMTERAVDSELIKLGSKTAQLRHLKEQIKMRVLGLGWDQFQTTWSKNGIEKTPKELATHLKNIIREGRSLEVPIEPPARLPTRKELPALGTVTQDVLDLDASRASKHQEFVESAEELRCEREAVGMGDLRGELQPTSHPPIDKSLVGKRIEMLFQFTENGTGENKFFEWCKGIIKRVSDGKNLKKTRAFYKPGEAVEIEWDTEYVEDGNPNCTTHVLLKSKWNPNVHNTEGSWRLDVG